MSVTAVDLARAIDHTLLRAEATLEDVERLCDEAWQYGFGAVCVNPVFVRHAARRLDTARGTTEGRRRPGLVSVAGFPLGASRTETKVDEARRAMDDGATEIDMVAAIGALQAKDRASVRTDIEAVARVVHGANGGVLKVILETAVLDRDRIILGCRCSAEGEADFVKTSTGSHPGGGATVEDVRLLHTSAAPMGVKAAGGIRTAAFARAMIDAGATRLGTSAGVAILDELRGCDT